MLIFPRRHVVMFHLAFWESIWKVTEADKKSTISWKAHFSTTNQQIWIYVQRKQGTPPIFEHVKNMLRCNLGINRSSALEVFSRCFVNMQQICKVPMPISTLLKSNFDMSFLLQNLLHIFRITFLKNTSGWCLKTYIIGYQYILSVLVLKSFKKTPK